MMPRCWAGLVAMLCLGPIANGQGTGDHPFGGRAVDAAGKPVAGATIRIVSLKTAGDGTELEVDLATKTDAQGQFQAAVPKRWLRLPEQFRQELGVVAA